MRTTIATVVVLAALVLIGAGAFIYSGLYDIAASEPHWGITRWAMETIRMRSIKAHAAGIAAPPGLDDPARIAMGTEHFSMHCAVCHGAPGVPRGEIAEGLYPSPPNLAAAAKLYSDAELFWIIKHGIKMTGMPGWSDHSDDELWATVAFLKKLQAGMTEKEYAELVKANIMHGMNHHPGGAPASGMPGMPGMPAEHDGHSH